MPLTVALPSPADRHHLLTYENHPQFGDYTYWSTAGSWSQRRQFPDGQDLHLCGHGRQPTDEQIALFHQIDERLPELTAMAIRAVEPPPVQPRRGWFKPPPPVFTREELVLREVRIEPDLTFELFFDSPTGDLIAMSPMVTFSDWRVSDSSWVC